MKKFCILKHPDRGYRAVKMGFSWPGFFFLGFWMLYHKLWVHFVGMHLTNFLIALVIVFLASEEPLLHGVLQLGVMLAVGFLGNRWLIEKWIRKGYEIKESVHAVSKEVALIKFRQAENDNTGERNHDLVKEEIAAVPGN